MERGPDRGGNPGKTSISRGLKKRLKRWWGLFFSDKTKYGSAAFVGDAIS